jgi:uncharacterized membrane protein HdeD (DUF308 family)
MSKPEQTDQAPDSEKPSLHQRAMNELMEVFAKAGLCGLVLIVQPSAGLSVVRWILVAYLLISGGSEVSLALRLRPDEGWAETLGGAVVSIAAGLVLWCGWPISGARAIGLLVGSKLISSRWAIMRVHRTLESAGDKLRSAKQAFAQRSAT